MSKKQTQFLKNIACVSASIALASTSIPVKADDDTKLKATEYKATSTNDNKVALLANQSKTNEQINQSLSQQTSELNSPILRAGQQKIHSTIPRFFYGDEQLTIERKKELIKRVTLELYHIGGTSCTNNQLDDLDIIEATDVFNNSADLTTVDLFRGSDYQCSDSSHLKARWVIEWYHTIDPFIFNFDPGTMGNGTLNMSIADPVYLPPADVELWLTVRYIDETTGEFIEIKQPRSYPNYNHLYAEKDYGIANTLEYNGQTYIKSDTTEPVFSQVDEFNYTYDVYYKPAPPEEIIPENYSLTIIYEDEVTGEKIYTSLKHFYNSTDEMNVVIENTLAPDIYPYNGITYILNKEHTPLLDNSSNNWTYTFYYNKSEKADLNVRYVDESGNLLFNKGTYVYDTLDLAKADATDENWATDTEITINGKTYIRSEKPSSLTELDENSAQYDIFYKLKDEEPDPVKYTITVRYVDEADGSEIFNDGPYSYDFESNWNDAIENALTSYGPDTFNEYVKGDTAPNPSQVINGTECTIKFYYKKPIIIPESYNLTIRYEEENTGKELYKSPAYAYQNFDALSNAADACVCDKPYILGSDVYDYVRRGVLTDLGNNSYELVFYYDLHEDPLPVNYKLTIQYIDEADSSVIFNDGPFTYADVNDWNSAIDTSKTSYDHDIWNDYIQSTTQPDAHVEYNADVTECTIKFYYKKPVTPLPQNFTLHIKYIDEKTGNILFSSDVFEYAESDIWNAAISLVPSEYGPLTFNGYKLSITAEHNPLIVYTGNNCEFTYYYVKDTIPLIPVEPGKPIIPDKPDNPDTETPEKPETPDTDKPNTEEPKGEIKDEEEIDDHKTPSDSIDNSSDTSPKDDVVDTSSIKNSNILLFVWISSLMILLSELLSKLKKSK